MLIIKHTKRQKLQISSLEPKSVARGCFVKKVFLKIS